MGFFLTLIITLVLIAVIIAILKGEDSVDEARQLMDKIEREQNPQYQNGNFNNIRFYGDNSSLSINNQLVHAPLFYFTATCDGNPLPHVIYAENINTEHQLFSWLAGGKKSHLPDNLLLKYLYGLEYRTIAEQKDLHRILSEAVTLHNRYYTTISFAPVLEGFIAYLILKLRTFTAILKQRLLAVLDRAPLDSPLFQSGAHLVVEGKNLSRLSILRAVITIKASYREYRQSELNALLHGLAEELSEMIESARRWCTITEAPYSYRPAIPLNLPVGHTEGSGLQIRLDNEVATSLQAAWVEGLNSLKKEDREKKSDKIGIATELLDYLKSKKRVPLKELNLAQAQENSLPEMPRNNFWEEALDTPCKLGELARELDYAACERLSEWESKAIAQTLAERGYNIEPDARYTRRGYRWNEQVIFYPAEQPSPPQSRDYDTALLLFKLGLYIAGADGEVDPEELSGIEQFIKKSVCKEDMDRARVDRLLMLAKAGALKPEAPIKRLLVRLTAREKSEVGRYLFVIAAADEIIDSLELEKIEHIFSRLGLTKRELNRSLEEFGLKEPPAPGIKLDPERLQKIMEETDRVQDILGKLFSAEEPELTPPSTDETTNEEAVEELPSLEPISVEPPPTIQPIKEIQQEKAAAGEEYSLPPELESFLRRILERDSWSKSELRKIAMDKGLMLENSLEQINFWCEEESGDYLVYEEGDRYTVQRELLKEWRSLY